jgi:xylan 1,4-beta-xylosidase
LDRWGISENYLDITEGVLGHSAYYWRVQATNVAGFSDWSEVRNFEVSSLVIRVNADSVVGVLDSTRWANIGYGPIYGDTINDRLQPFWELVRQTGAIQYIRCNNPFSDGVCRLCGIRFSGQQDLQELLAAENTLIELAGTESSSSFYCGCRVYSEDADGNPKLDFWHFDHVFDIFLSAGVKPIVECTFMPDALAEGEPVRNFCGGLVNTPKDYEKWKELIYQTVRHCIERYGVEEVRSWYWECWIEPDLVTYFIDGLQVEETVTAEHMERFLKMYDYFAEGAKSADSEIRIGGPAIARRDGEWLKLFLEHCTAGTNHATGGIGAPLDFISWHVYGSLDYIEELNRNRQEIIKLFPELKDIPQLQDEWGQEFSPVNPPTVQTNYEAAFLCRFLDTIIDKPSHQPALFMRWGKLAHPDFTTGWRPLYIWFPEHIIPLPIMNVYTMLAKMGNERLELIGGSYSDGVHGFASRTDSGIQILLYRFIEEDTSDESPPLEICLNIEGLPDSSYTLYHYRIDSSHSNATTAWEDMEQPDTPSQEQLMELESSSQLQLIGPPSLLKIKDGQKTIRFSLPPNAVSVLVLGEEHSPSLNPGGHISQVLEHEAMYKSALHKLSVGDTYGAKSTLKKLIEHCVLEDTNANPHCFWGQKALFTLGKLEKEAGNDAAADLIWQRLLNTTLNDTDRLILLQERIGYLKSNGSTLELDSLQEELELVRSRLKTFAEWTNWSHQSN